MVRKHTSARESDEPVVEESCSGNACERNNVQEPIPVRFKVGETKLDELIIFPVSLPSPFHPRPFNDYA